MDISLNHVRLPIGYWAFDVSGGEPFHQGQLPFLNNAVTWARNHGLKLIVDLRACIRLLPIPTTDVSVSRRWCPRQSERLRQFGPKDELSHVAYQFEQCCTHERDHQDSWCVGWLQEDSLRLTDRRPANMFKDQTDVVTAIAPLNEYVHVILRDTRLTT